MLRKANATDMAIGAKVHQGRLSADMSQEQLADKIGMSRQQIRKYECGQDRIGAARLKAIANALALPITFFYDNLPLIINQPMKQALTLQACKYFGEIKDTVMQAEVLNLLQAINSKRI